MKEQFIFLLDKEAIQNASQHSVHPTGGSLRVFRHFAWLEVGSGKMALSRPTHQRVTQAVGQQNNVKKNMMDSSNRSTLPHTFWKSFLAWVVTSSLITPLALLMGAIAGFIITPPDLGPFMGQPPREPLTILLIRALANSIISGSIIGLSQSWIVRQFVKVRFWIPATIIGLAFGDAIFYYSIDSGWVYIPWWGDFWQIVPALSVAISQAFLIYRKEYKVIWWLLAGGASIATSFIGLSIGDSFDSLLEQAIRAVIFAGFGALFSGIALLVTFRERLVIANSSNISPT